MTYATTYDAEALELSCLTYPQYRCAHRLKRCKCEHCTLYTRNRTLRWRQNPEYYKRYMRDWGLRKRYGISTEEYEA